jgi:hypothetical protein
MRGRDAGAQLTPKYFVPLSDDQVLDMAAERCVQLINPNMMKIITAHYVRTGEILPAVIRELNLEPVQMWRVKNIGAPSR